MPVLDIQAVLLLFWSFLTSASGLLPLQADRFTLERSTPGCRLGSKFYDLHATWTPSLEPRGPMFCLICKCNPVVKKGALQPLGKVTCRNIKDSCPNTEHCSSPIPAVGRCCKLCPGQEYTALLTGSSKVTSSNTSAVARGRFTLTSGVLHYSIQVQGFDSINTIQFEDETGNILNQEEIGKTDENDMVCGSWTGLSKTHIRYIEQQRIQIVVHSSKKDVHISGRILPHPAPDKEVFTVLLRDQHSTGSGAVAMLNYDVKKKNLDFILLLGGISLPMDTPSPVRLELFKKKRKVGQTQVEVLGDETQISGSWKSPIKRVLKNLPRSRLTLSVTTVTGKQLRGTITPRRTCNGFHALLSGQFKRKRVPSGAAGFAAFKLEKDGTLSYKVQLEGLRAPVSEVVLGIPRKRRSPKSVCKVIKAPRNKTESSVQVSGTCKRLKLTEVKRFLEGELEVHVATRRRPDGLLRGPIVETFYNHQINPHKEYPVVLSGSALHPPRVTFIAGRSWLAVDDLCVLHYDISVEGIDLAKDSLVEVTLNAVGRKSAEQVVIDKFEDSSGHGTISNIQRKLFVGLDKGSAMITVKTKAHPQGIIGGMVHLPNSCHGSKSKGNYVDIGILHDNAILPDAESNNRCSHGSKWYEDGVSWPRSPGHNCGMCSCMRGQVECHDGICPKVNCENPVTPPGECCPQCIDDRLSNPGSCYYEGDQSYHKYGTIWHPYVPLLGYSTCAICRCGEAGPDDVNCTRLNCPPLHCPLQEAVRINPTDCCQICPERPSTLPVLNSPTLAPIQAAKMPLNDDRSCASRGRVHAHGERWHPRIQPYGVLPCYTCLCLNSNIRCAKTVCPELQCKKKIIISGECCARCQV